MARSMTPTKPSEAAQKRPQLPSTPEPARRGGNKASTDIASSALRRCGASSLSPVVLAPHESGVEVDPYSQSRPPKVAQRGRILAQKCADRPLPY
jgi:hypothetical protein